MIVNPTNSTIERTITKASLVGYLRNYLNDPNGVVWTDAVINQYINQAETYVGDTINTIWVRFYIPIQIGVGTYGLSQNIKHITRITYRGFKVDILTQKEVALLSPVYRTQQSRPRWATWQFDGMWTLRLYPIPNENLLPFSAASKSSSFNNFQFNTVVFNQSPTVALGDPYTDVSLLNTCIVSAYLFVQESSAVLSLPDYMSRKVIRYYVLWKCFAMEGQGQDDDVAKYYKNKFDRQVKKIIIYNTRVYASKQRQLADVAIQRPFKKHQPILPPNFGPIVGY